MVEIMERLRDRPVEKLSPLCNILLGRVKPSPAVEIRDLKFTNETLNDSQKEAVRFSLAAPEIALIHGPPGVHISVSWLTQDGKDIYSHRNHKTTHLIIHITFPPRRRTI